MRHTGWVFLVVILSAWGAPATVRAGLIAEETFAYGDGGLDGQGAAGAGWGGGWVGANQTSAFQVASEALSVNLNKSWSHATDRALASVQGGPLYFSYDLSAQFGNRTCHMLFLGHTSGGREKFMYKISTWGGAPGWQINTQGDKHNSDPLNVTFADLPLDDITTTYRIVGKVEFDVNAADEDRFSIWVDPTGFETAAVSYVLTRESGIGSVNTVRFGGWRDGGTTAEHYVVDDFRVGTAWADVVPEPATLGLAALGVAAMVARRRWSA